MKLILILTISLVFGTVYSQNEGDIYRYSKVYHSGSARFESMGGAFGALGADLSAAQINPAGIGRFSSSQVSLSMGPTINSTNTTFNNETNKSIKTSFSVPNFGIVLTNDVSNKNNGNLYSQISFGMNRIANFNQRTNYSGEQYASLLDIFTSQAEGVEPNNLNVYFPFSTELAYNTFAIEYDPSNFSYYSYLNSGNVVHDRQIQTKCGINEWYITYSANRLNKLYYGGALAFRSSNFSEKYTHQETLVDTTGTPLRSFEYAYNLKTKGTGVNLKIGAIYMVTEAFRVGLAFHSPTFSEMTDQWSADMTTKFQDSIKTTPENFVPTGDYKYRINTPLKVIASGAYVIGLNALISADLEYVGYNMGRLKGTSDPAYATYNFKAENAFAKQALTSALNLRVGAEYNIQQKFFIRAGLSVYGAGFDSSQNIDNKADFSYSGGLGYRLGIVAIDIAYVNRQIQRNYYAFIGSQTAVNTTTNSFIVTGSIRF